MRVRSVKRVKPRTVFAVETSTGTFIADGLAHHNCAGCNIFGNGQHIPFTAFMTDYHGHEVMDEIVLQANTPYTYTIDELDEIREEYERKAEALI